MPIPLLSFFTGGGFLDIGFEQAGFEIIWTNEIKPAFVDMYEAGIYSWRISRGSSTTTSTKIADRTSITNLAEREIIRAAFASQKPPLFGIIGGPPCPDFSQSGTNEGVNGERGKLTQNFVDLICEIRPTFFVMENVPGLLNQKKHKPFLSSIIDQLNRGRKGYITDVRILNALEFGVPQNRDRFFLVGFQKTLLTPLYSKKALNQKNWFPWPQPAHPGAQRLPWPATSPFGGDVPVPTGIPIELTVNPLLTGSVEDLPNGTDVFIAYSDKFRQIAEGDVAHKSFKRLHRYRYSPTAWYGNNEVHLHPWKPRRLSVREALRIQTVPDEYIIPPGFTLTDKFKMIANGVPCRLAEHIARRILSFLRDSTQDARQ